MNDPLTMQCLEHVRQEETLLRAALPIVAGVQEAFDKRGMDAWTAALARHGDLVRMMDELQRRRRLFSETVARDLGLPAHQITLAVVQARLSPDLQAVVAEAVADVRTLAHELAAAIFILSVHVRIHLDAYRRILRDLTQTRADSGRYGPAGRAETLDYRPILQLNG